MRVVCAWVEMVCAEFCGLRRATAPELARGPRRNLKSALPGEWSGRIFREAMAFLPKRPRNAISLWGILLVLVVVLIAATLLFPALRCRLIEPEVKTQAKNDACQIATAISAYVSEYGEFPFPSKADVTISGGAEQSYIMDLLSGQSIGGHNPRKIVFLEIPKARNGRNGRVNGTGPFIDSWGNAYFIAFDGDENGVLQGSKGDAWDAAIRKRVFVWSRGDPKSAGFNDPKRWIKSWE